MVDNPTPPPVLLTDFELFNKPVEIGGKESPLQQAINVAQSITLRYDQSVFRFQFAALNYTAPQKTGMRISWKGSIKQDQADVRQFAARVLRGLGYTVVEAANSTEAIERAQERRIQLLVTDVVMPGLSGSELAAD